MGKFHADMQDRAVILAEYIIENKTTIRETAAHTKLSKSTVHKDVSERLSKINPALYREVKKVLDKNRDERHIRGGLATKRKYEELARKAGGGDLPSPR